MFLYLSLHTTVQVKVDALSMPVELAEDEQWRLINESGILQKVSTKEEDEEEEEDYPLAEEIFSAVTLIVPFSFLLLMMDMYVLSLVLMLKWTYR